MRNIILTMATLGLTSMLAQAQPKLTAYSVYDDFSTIDEIVPYADANRGIFWTHASNVTSLTRDAANKQMHVKMVQPQGMYTPFGVSFGNSNGVETGGTPNTIDLSANGTFSFDIINYGTEGISVRVACQDINDRLVDCDLGAKVFGDIWKYQIQVEVPAGDTVRFEAGVPNSAGAGILNTCDFTKGIWGDYGTHTIRTDFNLKQIKSINITVLNAEKKISDGHNVALTDGQFSLANFLVGDTSSLATSAPVPTIRLSASTLALADTAKSADTIDILSFTNVWAAKANASWLTVKIDTANGAGHITVSALANTASTARTTTVTLYSKYGVSETITVSQAASSVTGMKDLNTEKKHFHLIGHTLYFDESDVKVYSISGVLLAESEASSITLSSGVYVVRSAHSHDVITIQ